MAFGVEVDFTANVAKFSNQVDKISNDLSRFSKRTESSFNLASTAIKGFIGAFAVNEFAHFIQASVDAGDKLQKLSLRLGASVEGLSQLQHVADLSGFSFDTLAAGLQRMTRRIAEAANGSGEAVSALNELNLSAKALKQLSPERQFEIIADRISKVKESSDKTRLAMKLFDSEGVSLLQSMENGASGIQQMREESDRLGRTLTTQTANEMAAYNDAVARLEGRFEGFGNTLSSTFIPILADVADEFGNLIDNFNHSLDEAEKRAASRARSGRNRNTGSQPIDETLRDIFELEQNASAGSRNANRRRLRAIQAAKAAAEQNQFPDFSAFADQFINDVQLSGQNETGSKGGTIGRDPATNIIANLQRQIALFDDTSNAAKIRYELEHGSLKNVSAEQKIVIENYALHLDALKEAKSEQQEFDEIIEDGVRLARRQREEMAATAQRLNEQFNGPLVDLQKKINDIYQARGLGIIDEARAKEEFDKAGAAYNKYFIDQAKQGSDELAQYSIQAARSIQTAFADYLFDPFSSGAEGMLTTFRQILAQMASELIISNVSKAAQGFDWAGLASSVVGAFGGGLSSALSSATASTGSVIESNLSRAISAAFADGGIMTGAGPLPLNRYAGGGIADSPQLALFGEGRKPEAYVPLPDGRRIPVKMQGGSGGQVNHITINIAAPNGRVEPSSLSQIRAGIERSLAKAAQRNS